MKIYDEFRPCYIVCNPDNCSDNRMYFRREERRVREMEPNCCSVSKHMNPKSILLECGCHPEDANFDFDRSCADEHQAFILDRVIVDTSAFIKPLVKIEFSSIVFIKSAAIQTPYAEELEVNLLFELVRVCGGHEEAVQNWEYLKKFKVREQAGFARDRNETIEKAQQMDCDFIELDVSEPFTVTFCDHTCPGCCTYKMKVIGKRFKGQFEVLRVMKPDLSALAQDSHC